MEDNNLDQNNLIAEEKEPTNREIMAAIKDSKKETTESIARLEKKIDSTNEVVNELVEVVNAYATDIDKRFDGVENDTAWIRSNMATKDYLDRKIADIKGDLVAKIREEDKKLGATVETLAEKKVISEDDKKNILSMEPFPKLYV